ncbi:hypothetical protein [Clostridium intestinale]|uniref:Methyltransferase domain-containing protein n=1 Tax=Clostridium intestinale DSM 6191 TaxID=1121320 RepID=A0A1M5WTC6_9CLOT|nr:hypothetical protein [Clostridium intestinale]SHH90925.1 hypothetical protein SAMN02745941_01255 [Clostridium intestinale DSM 6191]
MNKTIVLNMNDVNFEGNILDVGGENYGIIYNIKKFLDEEVAVDYVDDSKAMGTFEYDTCVLFFSLGKINTQKERENMLNEIYPLIKEDGEIFLWDMIKYKNQIYKNKLRVILPGDKIKEFTLRDINFLKEWGEEDGKKTLEKYFEIQETKVWEDVYYIKAKKQKGSNTNEDTIASNKLSIHPQQSSSEIPEVFYTGLKL